MKVLKEVLLPYTVNGISILAAELLFSKPEVLRERVEAVVSGRRYLREQLEAWASGYCPAPPTSCCPAGGESPGQTGGQSRCGGSAAGKRPWQPADFCSRNCWPGRCWYGTTPRIPGCRGPADFCSTAAENPLIIEAIRDIIL